MENTYIWLARAEAYGGLWGKLEGRLFPPNGIRTFAVIHNGRQRIGRRNPRSHAADFCARRLFPVAKRRARPARSHATVPVRVDAHVANLHSREKAGE